MLAVHKIGIRNLKTAIEATMLEGIVIIMEYFAALRDLKTESISL